MKITRFPTLATLSLLAATLFPSSSPAEIIGPYTPDANTLHLWHLDESATPAIDFALAGGTNCVGLLNGATLGSASFAGFGSALNTIDGGQDGITARDALLTPSTATPPGNIAFTYANSTNGAFTFEAIVRIDFDPDKNLGTVANGGNGRGTSCEILTCESSVNASRIFQFRIFPKGNALVGTILATNGPYLTFENVRAINANQPTIYAPIPTNGPDAIVSNNWYHVAVTYNGVPNTAGNIKFYWTLLNPSRILANEIPITSAQTTLSGPNPLSTANTPPVIGNEARARTGNFLGSIDEVRISNIARSPGDMMFGQNNPLVLVPPVSQVVAVGQNASFNVIAAGKAPLAYQWRHEGTNLPGASQTALTIAAAQFLDAGGYDVVVTNNFNSVTSAVATLTVRTPLNLTWLGSAGSDWETNLLNWDTDGNAVADAAFSPGDNVTFDANGIATPLINLPQAVTPSAVTVNAGFDYTLSSTNNAGIGGTSRLVKNGAGTLILDVDNSFTGPTTINGGAIQIGTGVARGSLGAGPLTNNAALLVYRAGNLDFNYPVSGTGSLTNFATNTININSTNTLSGPIVLNAGALSLNVLQAKGNSTNIILNANANANLTRLSISGGMVFGAGVSLAFLGTTAVPDYRAQLNSAGGTNVLNGPIILGGDGTIQFNVDGTSELDVNTPVINSPDFVGKFILRGNSRGVLNSVVNIGGHLSKTDGSTWIINSVGNTWTNTDVANGTLRMGANGVFPSNTSLNMTTVTAFLDLNGFNQAVGLLTGPGNIGNSSTTADAAISANPPGPSLFSGVIQNSLSGGTRKVGLTLAGGTLTLSGTNTYTGDTVLSAGTLEFAAQGSISNSANIRMADGTALDASLRVDGTFTLNSGQVLKPTFVGNVLPNLVNNGTIELRLNKTGSLLTNDSLTVVGTVTYGGTLKLNVTASPALTTSDSFKLFSASSYVGAFANLVPAAPALGLAWDTSTLATDGILRIVAAAIPDPTNIVFQLSGNQLTLGWPSNYTGWRLQAQTNPLTIGLSSNWFDVPGSSATNQVIMPVNPANGTVFYRLLFP
ncbi:MAG TPA: autotransporter-associated beta strand repeat-containing protein [Methylomirabilota bacterium]|nr:autotransporter-associated beta strand repeat-containing protein [Methylomirabilota bacterium]